MNATITILTEQHRVGGAALQRQFVVRVCTPADKIPTWDVSVAVDIGVQREGSPTLHVTRCPLASSKPFPTFRDAVRYILRWHRDLAITYGAASSCVLWNDRFSKELAAFYDTYNKAPN